MAVSLNVSELVDEVRAQIDEFNEESIRPSHILQALNRAQKAATRITARRLDSIFLATASIDSSTGTAGVDGVVTFDMPKEIFGRRIEKVEILGSGSLTKVVPITFKQRDVYSSTARSSRPFYYDTIGSKFRLYDNIANGLEIIIHYTREPDRLILPQGQINRIDRTNNYVIVDAIGSDISTESDERASYVNIIDYVTGDIKVSLQVAFLDEALGQIKFKTSGLTRSTVYGKTISTSIPTTVTEDDYIALINGTCVSQMPNAYVDYFVQSAVVECKRRVREPTQEDYIALKDIEAELKKEVQGREQTMRVRKSNPHWNGGLGSNLRRIFS